VTTTDPAVPPLGVALEGSQNAAPAPTAAPAPPAAPAVAGNRAPAGPSPNVLADLAPAGGLASLRVAHYPALWACGATWNIARWMTIFLGSYLVDQLTGSPLLVQLVGTSAFLPMFVGGLAAGVVADRADRRRTVVRQLAALVPIAAVMAFVVATGRAQVWMVYLFVLAVGVGQVVDMTNRRALVNDVVGDRLLGNAMALEALSMSGGNMLGALFGGAMIGALGEGQAYGLVGVAYLICLALMRSVPSPGRRRQPTARPVSVREDLAAGVRHLPENRALLSLLGVTFLMNLLFFSYMPLVPLLARRFDVGPFLTGVLASGTGAGMLIGSIIMVVVDPPRRGRIYVLGSFVGMVCLIVFALMQLYPLALMMLVLTGIASAGFASVQSALVLSVAAEELRGRAMGLLSMAIGAMPFGMFGLGLLGEQIGAANAVVVSASTGIVALIAWLMRYPESLHVD
jgi:MFS family permease